MQDKAQQDSLMRFKAVLISIFIMMLLLPFKEHMAVSRESPWWTHFVYMMAHGNLIHLLVNAWALLLLHHMMKAYRVIAAYIMAVAISFVYYPPLPVVGASTIIMFLTGYLLPAIKREGGWSSIGFMAACMGIGLIVPQLAGVYHLICMATGLLFWWTDKKIQTTWQYCTND